MRNRLFIGGLATIIYVILGVACGFSLAFNYEDIGFTDVILNVILFCGLVPLLTLFAVLKWKKKGENLKLTEFVIFAALISHYFVAPNLVQQNKVEALYILLFHIFITAIMLFFYRRKQIA